MRSSSSSASAASSILSFMMRARTRAERRPAESGAISIARSRSSSAFRGLGELAHVGLCANPEGFPLSRVSLEHRARSFDGVAPIHAGERRVGELEAREAGPCRVFLCPAQRPDGHARSSGSGEGEPVAVVDLGRVRRRIEQAAQRLERLFESTGSLELAHLLERIVRGAAEDDRARDREGDEHHPTARPRRKHGSESLQVNLLS